MVMTEPTPGRWYVFVIQHALGVAHSLPLCLDGVNTMPCGGIHYAVSSGEGDNKVEDSLFSANSVSESVVQILPVH